MSGHKIHLSEALMQLDPSGARQTVLARKIHHTLTNQPVPIALSVIEHTLCALLEMLPAGDRLAFTEAVFEDIRFAIRKSLT